MCTNLYLHSACACKTSVTLSVCVCVTSLQLLLNLKENNKKQSFKIDPGTQKTWNAKYNKTVTAPNVVQYDVLHNT
jgi:hypothetical protein